MSWCEESFLLVVSLNLCIPVGIHIQFFQKTKCYSLLKHIETLNIPEHSDFTEVRWLFFWNKLGFCIQRELGDLNCEQAQYTQPSVSTWSDAANLESKRTCENPIHMNMYRDYTPTTIFSIIPHDSYLHNVHVGLGVINNLEIEVLERVQIGDKLRQWQLIESCVVLDLGMWVMTWNRSFADIDVPTFTDTDGCLW